MSHETRKTTSHAMSQTSDSNGMALAQLRSAVKGRIITPNDADYDKARAVFYGSIDKRPAAIVQVTDAADISRVVSFARETGTELAIRSGGHSLAGHSISEGGLVIDLSAMKGLEIDVEGHSAWAEAGLTAGEYTTALAAHGLATGFGDTASVGIGGLTLGGGIGYLVRKYGLTIDDLLAAEIVTADGQLLHVDATSHPDLFWAIRGGGGNFGVVTRFKYRLHELGKVLGGMLILPATADVLYRLMAEAKAAPEELSIITNVMVAPPMPFLPKEYVGQIVAMVMMVYAGDIEAGERAIAPFRALAKPIADMVRVMDYPEMYKFNEMEGGPPQEVARSLFVDDVDQQVTETIINYLRACTAPMAVAQLRALGGAMARVPVEATAFAHRKREFLIAMGAVYERAEETPTHLEWVVNFMEALRQGEPGVYVNFVGHEDEARVREAYPGATWERLAAIKARYDPSNLFRLNQNIRPASTSG